MPCEKRTVHTRVNCGVLSIPLEIRNQIYRELLLDIEYHDGRRKKIYPGILRASSRIYSEASRVLYHENCWVMIRSNYRIEAYDLDKGGQHARYVQSDVSNGLRNSFRGNASLRIDARLFGHDVQDMSTTIIVPLHFADQYFRSFTSESTHSWAHRIELTIRFEDSLLSREERQRDILFYLQEIRGVKKATVEGLPGPLSVDLTQLMTTPIQHRSEYYERILVYQSIAEKAFQSGRYADARDLYMRGLGYVRWASVCRFAKKPLDYYLKELAKSKVNLSIGIAKAVLVGGNALEAKKAIEANVLTKFVL